MKINVSPWMNFFLLKKWQINIHFTTCEVGNYAYWPRVFKSLRRRFFREEMRIFFPPSPQSERGMRRPVFRFPRRIHCCPPSPSLRFALTKTKIFFESFRRMCKVYLQFAWWWGLNLNCVLLTVESSQLSVVSQTNVTYLK